MKLKLLIASIVFAAMSSSAYSMTIERTFDITASDFFLREGSNTPAPVDPVALNFTLIFDPFAVITRTTAGLTINSFNLPFASTYANYVKAGAVTLTVGTLANLNDCGNPASSYCVFISDPAGASPTADIFYQATVSDGLWESDSVTLTAGAITVAPEPSTWALMLIGFGGIGWLGSRRRWAANAA